MMGRQPAAQTHINRFGRLIHHFPPLDLSMQLVGKLMAGATLPIPPAAELPGPDTAAFSGLDAYVRLLKRCCSQVAADRPPLVEVVWALRELLELLVVAT